MGGRFWRYVRKTFALEQQVCAVPESRPEPRIPARDGLLFGLLMFLLRRKSLLGAEQVLKNQKGWKGFFRQGVPGDTTVGRIFAGMDPGWLREQLWCNFYQAIRKKMLQWSRIATFWVIAYDGHETIASFARCCAECRRRGVRSQDATGQPVVRVQYDHAYSAASLVGFPGPQGIFDWEPIQPGENEVAATARLMQRAAAHFPRFHSIATVDALYLQALLIQQCLQAGQHVQAVLKGNCPELLDEVLRLAGMHPPVAVFTHQNSRVTLSEVTDLRLWEEQLDWPLRGVVAQETTVENYYEAGQRKTRTVSALWVWVTTWRAHEATARQIWQIGHQRWGIENRGFNVTPRDMGMNHCYKHHPTALLAFLLVLVWAQFLLACFYLRNLKAPLRNQLTQKALVALIATDLPQALLTNPP